MSDFFRKTGVLVALAALVTGCGYQLVGKGGRFPAGVTKVAVPVFANETRDTEIARLMTNHFIRGLLATGKVEVVSESEAEGVIRGVVKKYESERVTFDTSRNVVLNRLTVVADVSLVLIGQEEPVFEEKGILRDGEYNVPDSLSEQQKREDIVRERISRELSQIIIALMTEGF